MRSKSRAKSPVKSQEEDVEEDVDGAGADWAPRLEERLAAMEAARPDEAEALAAMAEGVAEIDLLEAAQLAAFEAGEERWWALNPLARDEFKFDSRMAARDHADLLSRAARQVDGAAGDEGAAIVDAHGD